MPVPLAELDPRTVHPSRYQPLVLLAAAVAGGIVADFYTPLPVLVWWLAAWILLALWLLLLRMQRERAAAILLCAAFAAAGGAWHHDRWRLYGTDEIGLATSEHSQPMCLEGVALTSPRWVPAPSPSPLRAIPRGDTAELLLQLTAVRDGVSWRSASGLAHLEVDGHLLDVKAGDRIRVMSLASRPAPPLNPGEFDYAAFERSRRVLCRLRGNFPDSVQVVERESRWLPRRWLSDVRDAGSVILRRTISPERAKLAAAILLGAREQLDPDRNEGYLVTGTIHILSISGLHVGILAVGFFAIFRSGLLPRRLTLVLAGLLAIVYAVLTDSQPPVVRATILIVATCTAQLFLRSSLGYNTLAAAGLVVLALNPRSLFLAGPQLSFLAVATMILAGPILMPPPVTDPLDRLIAATRPWPVRMGRWIGSRIWRIWLTGALVWITSLPLVWMQYGLISPVALVLNLAISIPIALALYAGFAALLLGWLVPPLASLGGMACDYSLAIIEGCIGWTQSLPGGHVWTAPPPSWWVAGFYVGLAMVAIVPRVRSSRLWLATAMAAWCLGGWLLASPPRGILLQPNGRPLACTFVAVGHGTAAIIELPDGRTLLYDCGRLGSPTFTSRQIASVLWSRGVTHLDAVIVSHADLDHYNALPGLLDRFSVGVVYVSPVMFERPQAALAELHAAIASHHVPLLPLRASDRLQTGSDARIEVLHPSARGVYGSDNANSIVLLIEYAGRRLLLPGDLASPGLEDLLAEEPIDCDVIMAPHHGSALSDPTGFALWSRPEFVVISGGREVVEQGTVEGVKLAYRSRGASVFHTAEDGAVRCELSAAGVAVTTFRQ